MKDIALKVLQLLIPILLQFLTVEQIRRFVDMAFDFVEDAVEDSDNPYDDVVVLPIIARMRAAFDIPDDDE